MKKKKKISKTVIKSEDPLRKARGIKEGYRSGLEEKVADQIASKGIKVDYENMQIKFVQPAKQRRYTPDFILPNGIIIETKGRFTSADRQKHLMIQEQHPELDIRFVFSNYKNRLNKTSKTTYADWCEKNQFTYANKWIPEEWFKEPKKIIKLDDYIICRRG